MLRSRTPCLVRLRRAVLLMARPVIFSDITHAAGLDKFHHKVWYAREEHDPRDTWLGRGASRL